MDESEVKNEYLAQVMQQKVQVEDDLRAKRKVAYAQSAPAPARRRLAGPVDVAESSSVSAGVAVDYRITGFWRWKNVIVPPNVYVVHTRRGEASPLHLGMGISFRFDPVTDSFLVVPAAMQTIIINANCICRERQGVVVQGYVQWIIDDFATAYKKLDFTDATDPMRVVNVQLREQAEAAIKDKVATMGIDEILADKQPIIEELTARLRAVAEGEGEDSAGLGGAPRARDARQGLGLRIVTVQIKEAVVCSPRVWEMLQRPFRAERARHARLAELESEAVVRAREAEAEKASARLRIEAESDVQRLESEASARAFDREESERARRAELEAATLEKTIAHEKHKAATQAELSRLRTEHALVEEALRRDAANVQTERELGFEAKRRQLDNEISRGAVEARLVDALPALARELPKPVELKSVQIGGADGLAGAVATLLALADVVRDRAKPT